MPTRSIVGADPDALERFASSLLKESRRLAAADQDVLALVRVAGWMGPEADRFRAAWSGSSGASLRRAADALAGMANEVKRQAADQRRASSAEGGRTWIDGIRQWAAKQSEIALAQKAMNSWSDDVGRPAIDRLRTGTPEEQRAWWASLTDEQRDTLLRKEPGRLTGLKGLDPGVLRQARESYFNHIARDIAVRKDTTSVSGGVRIPVEGVTIDLGATGSGTVTQMADGSATVALSLESKVAAQLGLKKSGGEVEGFRKDKLEAVYRFASKKEADAFLKGLRDEAVPKGIEVPLSLLPNYATSDITHDVVSYLNKNDGRLESMTGGVTLGAGASIGTGDNKVALEGAVGARHDLVSGDTTAFVRGSADASGALGVDGFKAAGEVEAGVTVSKNGELSSLSLSGSLKGTGGPSVTGFEVQDGARGSFEARVNVSDPAVRDAAKDYLSAVSHGDTAEANRQLSTLLANADVTLAVDQVSSEKAGIDAGVVYGSVEHETSTNKLTIVRPPGGDWMRYKAPKGAGRGGGGGGFGAW